MRDNITKGFLLIMSVFFILAGLTACKKTLDVTEDTKVKPPVRTYVVTARVDKKGTNSNSEGTAMLKGTYKEDTKDLSYTLEYKNIDPTLITLRSGAKGSVGSLITEIYRKGKGKTPPAEIKGGFTLNPLQERNLLKGRWFVTVNTVLMNPEISGVLTLKPM